MPNNENALYKRLEGGGKVNGKGDDALVAARIARQNYAIVCCGGTISALLSALILTMLMIAYSAQLQVNEIKDTLAFGEKLKDFATKYSEKDKVVETALSQAAKNGYGIMNGIRHATGNKNDFTTGQEWFKMVDIAVTTGISSRMSPGGIPQMAMEVLQAVEKDFITTAYAFAQEVKAAFPTKSFKGEDQSQTEMVESVINYWATMSTNILEVWSGEDWPEDSNPQTPVGILASEAFAIVQNQMNATAWSELGSTCVNIIDGLESLDVTQGFDITGTGIWDSNQWEAVGDWASPLWFTGVDYCYTVTDQTSTSPNENFCGGEQMQDKINQLKSADESIPFGTGLNLAAWKTLCGNLANMGAMSA